MKDLQEKLVYKSYADVYFGIGFGFTTIEGRILVILPFVVVLLVPEKIYG